MTSNWSVDKLSVIIGLNFWIRYKDHSGIYQGLGVYENIMEILAKPRLCCKRAEIPRRNPLHYKGKTTYRPFHNISCYFQLSILSVSHRATFGIHQSVEWNKRNVTVPKLTTFASFISLKYLSLRRYSKLSTFKLYWKYSILTRYRSWTTTNFKNEIHSRDISNIVYTYSVL